MPALADADELCLRLYDQEWAEAARAGGMRFAGLVLNMRGYERFIKSKLDTATLLISCTESHSKANSGKSFDDALKETCSMIEMCKDAGIATRGYASMAFGCPFEGDTDPARVQAAVDAMNGAGADTIILADTIGVAYPTQVQLLGTAALQSGIAADRLGLHMHDTYERAVDNCAEAVKLGFVHYDAAVGGLGGCPFAPGAAGNLATADLLHLLEDVSTPHSVLADPMNAAQSMLAEACERTLKNPFRAS